ncbi:hypothetical protein BDN71DRAFT_1450171 [Pleurotus eryngii]|uniref:Uncharacterized protein n=1 Tax=Pleurotus eryngii TaxID=5323 RepID=A0A9P6DEQ3_PLEER|nr:hypothetical protein BDN71DRAFT_1450171 [Pleurotus eryngii]
MRAPCKTLQIIQHERRSALSESCNREISSPSRVISAENRVFSKGEPQGASEAAGWVELVTPALHGLLRSREHKSSTPALALATFFGVALTLSSCTAWYYYRKVTREWELNLSLLGHPRGSKLKQTVVICGGSIAGLISARVCADHFQNVVIVDPEITKAGQEFAKKRVAQYDSLHAYLTFMVDGLRRLWPNLDTMVEQAGFAQATFN